MNEIMGKRIDQTADLNKEKEKEVENVDNTKKKNEASKYRNLYVIVEQVDGKIIPVGLEMLSEARRLIDDFKVTHDVAGRGSDYIYLPSAAR